MITEEKTGRTVSRAYLLARDLAQPTTVFDTEFAKFLIAILRHSPLRFCSLLALFLPNPD